MMRAMKKLIIAILLLALGHRCYAQEVASVDEILSKISYRRNSREWHNRNDHLIPTREEARAILALQQERDLSSRDIDSDGVRNEKDPSPLDWREIGYQPFGVLSFLSWRHIWNKRKYTPENLEQTLILLAKSGVSFVRMDFLWQDIEPRHGEFAFTKYDEIVKLCKEHNIRILGILNYCASWAGDGWNSPPHDLDDFVNYAKEVVSRYKYTVKYWEIWNEPDSKTYWQPQDEMKTYTELLQRCYRAAKEIDPSCKIVLGGMTAQGVYAMRRIYELGGKDYFDILNIHPFINPLRKQDLKRIYALYTNIERIQKQFADTNKKIWFTEVGCPGVPSGVDGKGWWEGVSPDEKEQANFLRTVYTDIIELPNLEKVFWAFFRDNDEHFKNDVDYFGLIRWDFSKKRSYAVYSDRYRRWRRLHKEL